MFLNSVNKFFKCVTPSSRSPPIVLQIDKKGSISGDDVLLILKRTIKDTTLNLLNNDSEEEEGESEGEEGESEEEGEK